MPGIVQWSIDQFYGELQKLEDGAKQLKYLLNADRQDLMELWDTTRTMPPAKMAERQALLKPQIHQNSTLRVMWQDINGSLVRAVNASAAFLRQHGYSVPNLSGLGFAVAIAPAAAVAIVVTALAVLGTAYVLTQSQRARTAALQSLWGNDQITVAEKLALIKAATDDEKAAAAANPIKFNVQDLVPILGLVALIMLGPNIMAMIPRGARR